MEVATAPSFCEISRKILARNDYGGIIIQPAGAAADRLEHSRLDAFIEEKVGAHTNHKELLLQIYGSRQPLDEQETAVVIRQVDPVIPVCDHGYSGIGLHKHGLTTFNT